MVKRKQRVLLTQTLTSNIICLWRDLPNSLENQYPVHYAVPFVTQQFREREREREEKRREENKLHFPFGHSLVKAVKSWENNAYTLPLVNLFLGFFCLPNLFIHLGMSSNSSYLLSGGKKTKKKKLKGFSAFSV